MKDGFFFFFFGIVIFVAIGPAVVAIVHPSTTGIPSMVDLELGNSLLLVVEGVCGGLDFFGILQDDMLMEVPNRDKAPYCGCYCWCPRR